MCECEGEREEERERHIWKYDNALSLISHNPELFHYEDHNFPPHLFFFRYHVSSIFEEIKVKNEKGINASRKE